MIALNPMVIPIVTLEATLIVNSIIMNLFQSLPQSDSEVALRGLSGHLAEKRYERLTEAGLEGFV